MRPFLFLLYTTLPTAFSYKKGSAVNRLNRMIWDAAFWLSAHVHEKVHTDRHKPLLPPVRLYLASWARQISAPPEDPYTAPDFATHTHTRSRRPPTPADPPACTALSSDHRPASSSGTAASSMGKGLCSAAHGLDYSVEREYSAASLSVGTLEYSPRISTDFLPLKDAAIMSHNEYAFSSEIPSNSCTIKKSAKSIIC